MAFKPYVLAAFSENVPNSITFDEGGTLPDEGITTPGEGGTTPDDGITTPDEGITTPDEGGTTPDEGGTTPDEGGTTPDDGITTPDEGGTTPDEGITTPDDDTNVTGNEMQDILSGLRESLSKKDADVETLADSVRSLVDVMSMESPQASDVYTPPEIPIAGYVEWNYPITVDYLVSIVGFEDAISQTEVYDSPAVFLEDYQNFAKECFLGGTFKDFSIEKICDADGVTAYDSKADETEPPEEEPEENLHPAMFETLASMDAHLAAMDATLADIASVSENSIAFYEDSVKLYRQANELTAQTLAVNLALLFVLVVMLGHRIAHAFWQRMKVG